MLLQITHNGSNCFLFLSFLYLEASQFELLNIQGPKAIGIPNSDFSLLIAWILHAFLFIHSSAHKLRRSNEKKKTENNHFCLFASNCPGYPLRVVCECVSSTDNPRVGASVRNCNFSNFSLIFCVCALCFSPFSYVRSGIV